MKNIDLTYWVPLILSLISVVGIFSYGKTKVFKNSPLKTLRYIPLISVIALLMGVFYITFYYQKELSREKEKFLALQQQNYYNDSILLTSKAKNLALDSLRILNEELKKILANINKQEKITGEFSDIRNKIQAKITKTNEEIGSIESYNEIIEKPHFLDSGYSTSGNTSNFAFFCPTDTISEYIDLKLRFQDKSLIRKIACIYLTITQLRDDNQNWLVFSQTYKPKEGVNAFKIKNYLRDKKVTLDVGYILISETQKKYPTFEKISCKNY